MASVSATKTQNAAEPPFKNEHRPASPAFARAHRRGAFGPPLPQILPQGLPAGSTKQYL
jgi:hypothetical protein